MAKRTSGSALGEGMGAAAINATSERTVRTMNRIVSSDAQSGLVELRFGLGETVKGGSWSEDD